jgi:DMSO/TMAO reductase YedYZ molybdopterin-dependent catalytic subunit
MNVPQRTRRPGGDIWAERASQSGAPVGRRVFLGLVALGAGTVLAGGPVSRRLSALQSGLAAHDATGLSGLVPGGGWRYYTVTDGYPSVDHAAYRLKVAGLVDRPMSLSLAQLGSLPRTRMTRDFHCVTGWTVRDVPWEGVRLADLLESAGAHRAAGGVLFRSFDGVYTESLSMAQAMRPDVLVADRMLDGEVSRIHGGPVRMYVAPMYGYKSTKWLSEIRVVPRVVPGYWEHFGYDQDGWVGASNGYGT